MCIRDRSYTGFITGESAASLTTPPTCSTAAVLGSPVGTYTSTCSGAVDANYTISYATGLTTVGPVALLITASSDPMTYGGSVPTISASYTGFITGESAASLT